MKLSVHLYAGSMVDLAREIRGWMRFIPAWGCSPLALVLELPLMALTTVVAFK